MRNGIYLLAVTVILGTSCNKKTPDPTPTPPPTPAPAAKVIFTNACLNSTALAVKINDTTLSSITGLDFLANSGYKSITPGTSVKTSFVFSNTSAPLVTPVPTYNFVDGGNYSVFAIGQVTSPGMVEYSDDLAAPASGKSKVRIINLSLDSLSYDFYVVGTGKLDSGVTFKSASPFREVTAADNNVIIQDPTDVSNQVTISPQHFVTGKIYTIVVTGSKNFTGVGALKATVITNN